MTEAVEETLGQMLVRERAAGKPWKILMRCTGLSRTRLYEIWRAETDAGQVDQLLDDLAAEVRAHLASEGWVEVRVNGAVACVLMDADVAD